MAKWQQNNNEKQRSNRSNNNNWSNIFEYMRLPTPSNIKINKFE